MNGSSILLVIYVAGFIGMLGHTLLGLGRHVGNGMVKVRADSEQTRGIAKTAILFGLFLSAVFVSATWPWQLWARNRRKPGVAIRPIIVRLESEDRVVDDDPLCAHCGRRRRCDARCVNRVISYREGTPRSGEEYVCTNPLRRLTDAPAVCDACVQSFVAHGIFRRAEAKGTE